jgi:hypothetical protein
LEERKSVGEEKSSSSSAFERKKELDERIAGTKDKMNFSQVSIDYDVETMCNLCHASSSVDLGILSCCKRTLIPKKCWEVEVKQQSSRKKVSKEVRALEGRTGKQIIVIGSPCCRDPTATFIMKQDLCRYCSKPLGN